MKSKQDILNEVPTLPMVGLTRTIKNILEVLVDIRDVLVKSTVTPMSDSDKLDQLDRAIDSAIDKSYALTEKVRASQVAGLTTADSSVHSQLNNEDNKDKELVLTPDKDNPNLLHISFKEKEIKNDLKK